MKDFIFGAAFGAAFVSILILIAVLQPKFYRDFVDWAGYPHLRVQIQFDTPSAVDEHLTGGASESANIDDAIVETLDAMAESYR